MIKQVFVASILATTGLLGSAGQNDAFACTKTNGCIMDVFRDDYDMKRDGRMEEAVRAGRANVEAFRSLQAAQQKSSGAK